MGKSQEIALLLRRSHWAVHRRTDAALKGERVTANQFVLLSLLAKCDGIRQHELVERASSDPNTVGAMLVVLERNGLVTRDRRARLVRLSAAGSPGLSTGVHSHRARPEAVAANPAAGRRPGAARMAGSAPPSHAARNR